MNRKILSLLVLLSFSSLTSSQSPSNKNLFEFDSSSSPRWSSFENITAEKGKGGMENNGAKGHPSNGIEAGETKVLLNVQGPGIVNRMWATIIDRSPEMLRSLKLEMFWDGETKPAVSVPFGDFFGIGLGQTAKYHNVFFANPEGRSFLCYIPMPFKKSAKIQITNESGKRLSHLFFDVNLQKITKWNPDFMYFHSFWSRDTATTLGEDFQLLPTVNGRGRFLGVNVGVNANRIYENYWWGEGEVKMYVDGDQEFPTLVGTGTEDYIGTAWGQGEFFNDYAGCLIANKDTVAWAFYRYHVPDPVYFKKNLKVALQQMGGNRKELVIALQKKGVPMIPVGIDDSKKLHPLYKKGTVPKLDSTGLPEGFSNFYRSDDVSATSYFYLDKASTNLPLLQPLDIRLYNLKKKS
ncbi:MAG TPA: glycoside hydrolase family 172 protein [Flavitalea sp.]|nr:glycoside hydrolase family 172 protein [Flavitalea sp.]